MAKMLWELGYIIFCLAFAKWNAVRIKNDLPIRHGYNSMAHIAVWAITFYFVHSWGLLIAMPLIGRLFFDTALNIFRDKSIAYVPMNPKSIVDKAEKMVFGNDGIAPKIVYLAAAAVINFIIFSK